MRHPLFPGISLRVHLPGIERFELPVPFRVPFFGKTGLVQKKRNPLLANYGCNDTAASVAPRVYQYLRIRYSSTNLPDFALEN
jgi:hypothetical protein